MACIWVANRFWSIIEDIFTGFQEEEVEILNKRLQEIELKNTKLYETVQMAAADLQESECKFKDTDKKMRNAAEKLNPYKVTL